MQYTLILFFISTNHASNSAVNGFRCGGGSLLSRSWGTSGFVVRRRGISNWRKDQMCVGRFRTILCDGLP